MKKFSIKVGLSFLILICASSITLLILLKSNFSQSPKIIYPIPEFLTLTENPQVSTINLWDPILDFFTASDKTPIVSAKSTLLYDLTTNKILYSSNSNKRLPMASLTKIMTAIVALENKKSDDKYIVKSEDLVGEDTMGLESGEILSLNELLYGLILNSGNDAAETIASNFKNGRREFIKAMNNKAKALGLKDTNFTNPTGLEGDGNQYTTAHDLLVMTEYALKNFPEFNRVSQTFQYQIDSTNTHKAYYLENETNLISSYPGVKGVKTGYTPEAGLCLVTYLDYKGHKIIGILLNSDNRRQTMKDLLDFALSSQGIKPPPHI